MPTHDLMQLKRELESPRLSGLRSTLGLAVPHAALHLWKPGSARAASLPVATVENGGAPGG